MNTMKTIPKLPLRYDSGKLFWTESQSNGVQIDQEAGFLESNGYVRIRFKGHAYLAHRIIWTLHHGPIPVGHTVDHINRIRSDNRIKNLRLAATGTQQNGNSLAKGYYLHKPSGKFQAQIKVGGRQKSLGYYENASDARAAYVKAHRETHNEFSPYNWEMK